MIFALAHISLKKITKVHPKIKMREHIHFLLKPNANLVKYVAKIKAFKIITLILYTKIANVICLIWSWNVYNIHESEIILNKYDTFYIYFFFCLYNFMYLSQENIVQDVLVGMAQNISVLCSSQTCQLAWPGSWCWDLLIGPWGIVQYSIRRDQANTS